MRTAVRVVPKARRNAVKVADDGSLRVRVTAAPEDGKANEALVSLLSKQLQVPKFSVRVVRGHRARDKVVEVDGLSAQEMVDRLRAVS
jgi:uncharacterized protein (TIGR00251 family)